MQVCYLNTVNLIDQKIKHMHVHNLLTLSESNCDKDFCGKE